MSKLDISGLDPKRRQKQPPPQRGVRFTPPPPPAPAPVPPRNQPAAEPSAPAGSSSDVRAAVDLAPAASGWRSSTGPDETHRTSLALSHEAARRLKAHRQQTSQLLGDVVDASVSRYQQQLADQRVAPPRRSHGDGRTQVSVTFTLDQWERLQQVADQLTRGKVSPLVSAALEHLPVGE